MPASIQSKPLGVATVTISIVGPAPHGRPDQPARRDDVAEAIEDARSLREQARTERELRGDG